MTTEEMEQATELMNMLADIEDRYPAVTPALRDELEALVTKLQTMYSSEVAKTSMRVIGQTHTAIRNHQRETDSQVSANTTAIAALVAEHVKEALDARLTRLEQLIEQRTKEVGGKRK